MGDDVFVSTDSCQRPAVRRKRRSRFALALWVYMTRGQGREQLWRESITWWIRWRVLCIRGRGRRLSFWRPVVGVVKGVSIIIAEVPIFSYTCAHGLGEQALQSWAYRRPHLDKTSVSHSRQLSKRLIFTGMYPIILSSHVYLSKLMN